MAKKQKARPNGFVLFNVIYEDGTPSSNRKIAVSELSGLDGDAPARSILETQDREIAEKSGRPRGAIKEVRRADARRAQS